MQRIADEINQPLELDQHVVRVSASIGIALFPDDGTDTHTLMRSADLAMYEAKRSDNHWHFFAKTMSDRVETRLKLEASLLKAAANNELYLVYQPKISCKSGELSGAEVLLRWKNAPDEISPMEFVAIAEESGIILEIGQWILEQTCQQIKQWHHQGIELALSINVSARQLQSPNFVHKTMTTIKKFKVPTQLIELEITETVMLQALKESQTALNALRGLGFKINIDDFGTGYSSLSYLTQLPADVLKIDKSFISGPNRSPAILKMIVSMAKTMNLETVAEGVETVEQRQWLINEGCDYMQGYFFSHPLSISEFENRFIQQLKQRFISRT